MIEFIGYVPVFDTYRKAELPKAESWYESKVIYEDAYISDNIEAFYSLARQNIDTINSIINSQPNL